MTGMQRVRYVPKDECVQLIVNANVRQSATTPR